MKNSFSESLWAITWAYDTPQYQEWAYVIVGFAALGGVAWLCAKFFHKPDRQYGYNEPRALFGELCRTHKLSWGQRRLLKSLARQQRLANPACVFLMPELFESANLKKWLARNQTQIAALRQRLFG